MKIEIKYDGDYPNLCSRDLKVIIDGKEWDFPAHCLESGGSVWFDDNWHEHIETGEWSVSSWPDGFPEELKDVVVDEINGSITWGCCGGCV